MHYSRDGRFIRRVGHIGRGPGEYSQGNGVRVDEKRGILYILFNGDAVLRYELDTGRFIDQVTIDFGDDPITSYMAMSQLPITDSVWFISQHSSGMFLDRVDHAAYYSRFRASGIGSAHHW